jgi:ABC-type multidrug transport system ATPase subunit/ABC-type transporter Mla maintaining outer membrane lipid asymmetry permease subunit MlaE
VSTPAEPALVLRGFRLAYQRAGGEHVLLEDVDLTVPRGGFYLLVGESGSGKSSLLRLLTGLWEVREPPPRTAGELLVLGKRVHGHYPSELRRGIAAVLQDEGLLDDLSPVANVELALRAAGRSPKLALGLLAQTGLDDPPSHVAALSGGMRKRVAIARALASQPELLLFDEPTAGLDDDAARDMARLLADTRRAGDATTIVITHDLDVFEKIADGVLLLDPAQRRLGSVTVDVPAERAPAAARAPSPEDPAITGMRHVLLGLAGALQTFGEAIVHLPPVHLSVVLRTVVRYALEPLAFTVLAAVVIGGLATFFSLRNNPLESAFTAQLVTGVGKVLVAVLVPLMVGFFFTARMAAGAAARVGTMKRTNQIAALQVMGIRPSRYLLTPLVWAMSLAMPLVTAAGIVFGAGASWIAYHLVTGASIHAWAAAFFRTVSRGDLQFVAVKSVLSGFLVAVSTYHLASGPKRSGRDVGNSVNSSIVVGLVVVLVVHALLTLLQFG